MSITQQDLQSFTSYAQRIIASGGGLSIDELFDQWRIENPSVEAHRENVNAINASIQDYQRSERGTLSGEHSAQIRRQYGA